MLRRVDVSLLQRARGKAGIHTRPLHARWENHFLLEVLGDTAEAEDAPTLPLGLTQLDAPPPGEEPDSEKDSNRSSHERRNIQGQDGEEWLADETKRREHQGKLCGAESEYDPSSLASWVLLGWRQYTEQEEAESKQTGNAGKDQGATDFYRR